MEWWEHNRRVITFPCCHHRLRNMLTQNDWKKDTLEKNKFKNSILLKTNLYFYLCRRNLKGLSQLLEYCIFEKDYKLWDPFNDLTHFYGIFFNNFKYLICWNSKWKQLLKTDIGKDCVNRIPVAQEIIPRVNKWNSIKWKSFCTEKEIASRVKRQPTAWEKIFTSCSLDRGLKSRIY